MCKGAAQHVAQPKGHAKAKNPQNDPDNLIDNGSFESDSFSSVLTNGLWYPSASNVKLARLSDYSHSGSHSLRVSNRELHWNRAMYRVDGNDLSVGHTYKLQGYVSSLERTRAELWIAVWAGAQDEKGIYPGDGILVDTETISPKGWQAVEATFTLSKVGDNYVISCAGKSVSIPVEYGVGCLEIEPQTQPGAYNVLTDMYIDSFSLKDVTSPRVAYPALEGHADEEDTENIDGNLIVNSSFEAELISGEQNCGLWFTNGTRYKTEFTKEFSHSGEKSVRIHDRKNGNNTLLFRVEGTGIKLDVEHELSGWLAASKEVKANLQLRVYGFDGKGNYPSEAVTLDAKTINSEWENFKSTFSIGFKDDALSLSTPEGETVIDGVEGLSSIEIWADTESDLLWEPDLYLDSFSLVAGKMVTDVVDGGADEDPLINSVKVEDGLTALRAGAQGESRPESGINGVVMICSAAAILASFVLMRLRVTRFRRRFGAPL
jgi:hypothetical protein